MRNDKAEGDRLLAMQVGEVLGVGAVRVSNRVRRALVSIYTLCHSIKTITSIPYTCIDTLLYPQMHIRIHICVYTAHAHRNITTIAPLPRRRPCPRRRGGRPTWRLLSCQPPSNCWRQLRRSCWRWRQKQGGRLSWSGRSRCGFALAMV